MDVIWGVVQSAVGAARFEIDVTHRKDGNRGQYSDREIILISESDVPGIPRDPQDITPDIINQGLKGQFIKCEIKQKDAQSLHCKISHSGAGGY